MAYAPLGAMGISKYYFVVVDVVSWFALLPSIMPRARQRRTCSDNFHMLSH